MFTFSLFIARDVLGYFFQHAICVHTKSYRRLARSHFQVPVDFFEPRKSWRNLCRLRAAFSVSVRQALTCSYWGRFRLAGAAIRNPSPGRIPGAVARSTQATQLREESVHR
jgi:hypothetical protein